MVRRRKSARAQSVRSVAARWDKLWPDWLRRIDTLLEDEAVIEVVAQALERGGRRVERRGRPGTPAEVVIRMLILKHLFDGATTISSRRSAPIWCIARLHGSMRTKCRMRRRFEDCGGAGAGGHRALAPAGRRRRERAGVTRGRRFRIDTTVVETNVHYPTDSTLLQDGVVVDWQAWSRAGARRWASPGRARNRRAACPAGVLAIGRQSRSPKTRDTLIEIIGRLMATTRAVQRDAETMSRSGPAPPAVPGRVPLQTKR